MYVYLVKFPDFRNFSNFPHFPHFPREIVQIFPLPAGNEKRGKCAALVRVRLMKYVPLIIACPADPYHLRTRASPYSNAKHKVAKSNQRSL